MLAAWLQMGIFYFVSPRVTRSLVYGLAARNRLDLYRPPAKSERPPKGYRVVIYITGGLRVCLYQVRALRMAVSCLGWPCTCPALPESLQC